MKSERRNYELIFSVAILFLLCLVPSTQAADMGEIRSGETRTGNITYEAQIDLFTFYGTAGQAVVIEMAAFESDLVPALYLYRPNGTLELDIIGGYDSYRVAVRAHQLEQNGIYTIVTSASWANGTSKTGKYALSLMLIPGATTSEQDPDGGDIASWQTYNGTIYPTVDTNAFAFYGVVNQTVVIDMAAFESDLGPALYLYRPNGTLELDIIGGYDSNRVTVRAHQLEQTGIYTIVTSASWANGTSKTGKYALSFAKIPATLPPGIYDPFPANGATITVLKQSFTWDVVSDATGYDLYFGDDAVVPLEKIGENLTSHEVPFPEMEWDKVYYWHVEAHLPSGTIQGPYWWFKTTSSGPIPPTEVITNTIGMEFVPIAAGEFEMGSPPDEEGGYDWEGPIHLVTIENPFYMGRYEVTQQQWRAIMGDNPSYFMGDDDRPVERVSWNDVQEFIKKLNEKEGTGKYRLPSEAEWEYTCRAGTTTRYSFGDDDANLGDYAWYWDNSDYHTHPVGQKKANPWGLNDMHGNVWEWVQDKGHSNYEGAPADGSAWEDSGADRVFRGGGWNLNAWDCRSALRDRSGPRYRDDYLGLRILKEQ